MRKKIITLCVISIIISLFTQIKISRGGEDKKGIDELKDGTSSSVIYNEKISLGNPAAMYCGQMGYKYNVEDSTCEMPDGSKCKGWEFYGGQCGREYSYCEKKGLVTRYENIRGQKNGVKEAICYSEEGERKEVVNQRLGINEAMDTAEYKSKLKEESPGMRPYGSSIDEFAGYSVPSSFDWRSYNSANWTTPAKDQGQTNTCWAFSANGVAESMENIAAKNAALDVSLSEQYLISGCFDDKWEDQSYYFNGTLYTYPAYSYSASDPDSGGYYTLPTLDFIRTDSIVSSACYPFDTSEPQASANTSRGSCPINWSDPDCTQTYSFDYLSHDQYVSSDFFTGVGIHPDDIKKAIVYKGPVAAGINATYTGWSVDANDAIACSSTTKNHGVVLVGYNDTDGYWIAKNSWGTNVFIPGLGIIDDNGFIKIQYGECEVETDVFYIEKYRDLDVSVTGGGTVTDNLSKIDCGTDCVGSYTGSKAVTLTATPSYGYAFTGWGGTCSGGSSTCDLDMLFAESVTADFTCTEEYSITSSVVSGSGTITPLGASSVCVGESKAFTMTPNAGNRVSEVEIGPTGGPYTSLGVRYSYEFENVTEDKEIRVTFEAGEPHRLYQAVRGGNSKVYTRHTKDGYGWESWVEASLETEERITTVEFNGNFYQAITEKGTDKIWTRYTTDGDTWEPWVYNGKTPSEITMVVFNPGGGDRLYQAVRASDDKIWTRYTEDGVNWGSWTYNGKTPSTITMIVFNGRLYQAVRAGDDKIWTRYTTDGETWEPWVYNGKTPTTITMTVFNPGGGDRLYQAVRAGDDKIWTRYTTDGDTWGSWVYDGKTPTEITMTVFNPGGGDRLYQAVRAGDDKIWTRYTEDGETWAGWVYNGKTPTQVSMTEFNSKLIQSVRAGDDKIWTRLTEDGSIWEAWEYDGKTPDFITMGRYK